jgi:hypothetical protein
MTERMRKTRWVKSKEWGVNPVGRPDVQVGIPSTAAGTSKPPQDDGLCSHVGMMDVNANLQGGRANRASRSRPPTSPRG